MYYLFYKFSLYSNNILKSTTSSLRYNMHNMFNRCQFNPCSQLSEIVLGLTVITSDLKSTTANMDVPYRCEF